MSATNQSHFYHIIRHLFFIAIIIGVIFGFYLGDLRLEIGDTYAVECDNYSKVILFFNQIKSGIAE